MKKTLLSLLLVSAVFATPVYANYFSTNSQGSHLNVGSAPNPKPGPVIERRAYVPAYVEPAPQFAPRVVAQAEPAPPPPPAIRTFVVFFDFDKANLSREARDIVASAVATAQETGMVRVLITGHTDTVGSQRYNQVLSERRAGAVKTEIVRLGLNARDVRTIGRSFSDPLVPTGPGVREPQNRRAVIDLGFDLTAGLVR
jgi:outer membrane protein OmpA-like peptidoglycan-associated protein